LIKFIHTLNFIHNKNKISKSLRNKRKYTFQQVNVVRMLGL
jgi:predicted RNA-binding protein